MEANVPSWHDAAVWLSFLAIFLALELPPAFIDDWPWNTLSWSTWRFEAWWHLARVLVAVFLIALCVHLTAKVPAAWLVTVAVCAGVGALGRLVYERLV